MSNAPQGPDWFQASNGKWYPPAKPKAPEAAWIGPLAWTLFLGGFLIAVSSGGAVGAVLLGALSVVIGLGMLAATGRIFPKR